MTLLFREWRASGNTPTRRVQGHIAVAVTAACGETTPTTPGQPGPSVQAIAILGDSAMAVGSTQTLTAQVALSDGRSGQAPDVTWCSCDFSIASVTPPPYYSGPTTSVGPTTLVRACASALVSVFADYGGKRGEPRISVVPSYEGAWLGSYTVTACAGTGSAEDLACRQTFRTGTLLPIALTLTQSVTSVSGVLTLGPTAGSVTGSAFADGSLILSSRTQGAGMEIAITDWSTSQGNDRMQGAFSLALTFASLPGVARVSNSPRAVERTG